MPARSSSTARDRRHARVRATIHGSAHRPRLVVFRSLAHIDAQLIDDLSGKTLVAVNDRQLKLKGTKTERATVVGKGLAEQATAKKITRVVFDRGGYQYHGRVKAVAEAARAGGLQF